MERGDDLLRRIEEQYRNTVGDTDCDHDLRLVGDDAVALKALEMEVVGIGGVEHQKINTVNLSDGHEPVRLSAKGMGEDVPVSFNIMRGIKSGSAEVQ